MKTEINPRLFLGAMALLVLLPVASRAAETTTEAKEQKSDLSTHVLFTGTDIQVLYHGTLYRVRGVDGGSFIIKVKDKDVEIPMGMKPEQIKVAKAQVLTDRTATLAKYKYERAYTPANDPVRKWTPAMAAADEMNEAASNAEYKVGETPKTMRVREGNGPNATFKTVDNPQYEAVTSNFQRNASRVSGNMGSMNVYTQKIAEEQALELFDALDVEFEVSSAKPIHSPYVVIVAKYHEKEDPQHPQNWLFAKALDPIDVTPRKVFVREAGFPLGFVVDKLQVHLYEHGLEIATDQSENRAPLSREEAHEYLVIDHVSMHKADTLPARVALTKMPEDWATHAQGESFRKTYYVKVDQTGHPVESFEDEACHTKVADSYYEGVLGDLLFLPALEHGKAVDSVARVKLNEQPK